MNNDQFEQLFADWSATRPDLIHNAWDMTNAVQLLRWAFQEQRLSVGAKQPNSVE